VCWLSYDVRRQDRYDLGSVLSHASWQVRTGLFNKRLTKMNLIPNTLIKLGLVKEELDYVRDNRGVKNKKPRNSWTRN
jgi:hypothetical protein